MSPLTYNKYEGDWRRHLQPAFGKLPLGAIDQPLLLQYMRTTDRRGPQRDAPSRTTLTVLCGMLTDAMAEGHIANNPLRTPTSGAATAAAAATTSIDLQRPSASRRRYLEVARGPRAARRDTHSRTVELVLLALTSGFRRYELLGLRWEWLDWGASRSDLSRAALLEASRARAASASPSIVRCKYDSEREVPLCSGLAQLLAGAGRRQAACSPTRRRTSPGMKPPSTLFLGPAYEDAAACAARVACGTHYGTPTRQSSPPAASAATRSRSSWATRRRARPGSTRICSASRYEKVEAVLDEVYGPWMRPHIRGQRRAERARRVRS